MNIQRVELSSVDPKAERIPVSKIAKFAIASLLRRHNDELEDLMSLVKEADGADESWILDTVSLVWIKPVPAESKNE